MRVPTVEQVNMAIKAIEKKMFVIGDNIANVDSLDGTMAVEQKQAEIAEITLDALKFYRDNGLGQSIDRRI